MRDAKAEIDGRDVHVVVVGNGRPHHAKMFREDDAVPFTLWVDPELRAYRAAGLRRGLGAVFSRRSLVHAARALKAGFRQTKTKGDPWQNGGVFVITPKGRTVYEQVSEEAGDHAPLHEILVALDRALAAT